ncbi:hypothetical protein DFQ28_001166, partial [Apophysomyces sp. BC1034]
RLEKPLIVVRDQVGKADKEGMEGMEEVVVEGGSLRAGDLENLENLENLERLERLDSQDDLGSQDNRDNRDSIAAP